MIIVPLVAGKPLHIWLGIILIPLLATQIILGVLMIKGRVNLLRAHKIFAILIALTALIHLFYGLGIWFFNFIIK